MTLKIVLALAISLLVPGSTGKQKERKLSKTNGGLQPNCFDDDKSSFNICLDLTTAKNQQVTGDYKLFSPDDSGFECLGVGCFAGLDCWPINYDTFECEIMKYEDEVVSTEYVPWWMDYAIEAADYFEKLIKEDTVPAFKFMPEWQRQNPTGANNAQGVTKKALIPPFSSINGTDENWELDDTLVVITENVPLSFLPDSTTSSEVTLIAVAMIQMRSSYDDADNGGGWCFLSGYGPPEYPSPVYPSFQTAVPFVQACNVYLVQDLFPLFKNDPASLRWIFLHEFMHCLGLELNHVRDVQKATYPKTILSPSGRVWEGEKATEKWSKVGCSGPVPLVDPTETGLHLDSQCIQDIVFGPLVDDDARLLTDLEAAMLEDIGYAIDYKDNTKSIKKERLTNACGLACPEFVDPTLQPSAMPSDSPTKKPTAKPTAPVVKTKKRRLRGRGTPMKGAPKNGSRKLNTAENIPEFSPENTMSQQSQLTEAERDSFMRLLYDFFQKYGGPGAASANAIFASPDGTFFEVQATVEEAKAYAKLKGFAHPHDNVRRLFEQFASRKRD